MIVPTNFIYVNDVEQTLNKEMITMAGKETKKLANDIFDLVEEKEK